jgi:thiol-disulfide isomerase/thioredoxin
MAYASMSETSLKDEIKHYPSFVIIKDGKVVDYLDAESDKHTKYYKSAHDFAEWIKKYIKLNDPIENQNTTDDEITPLKKDVELDNVTYDENKINIYFFWGNGCNHCENEFKFFKEIEEDYGHLYKLNTFEVWYDEENEQNSKVFASHMNDKLDGVPYTIIGNKTFKGFKTSYKEEMLDAIKTQYKNIYDVYFEKIKK